MKPRTNSKQPKLLVAEPQPLGGEEFAALMARLGSFPSPLTMAVAVSGGPDSMALAFCAKRWADEIAGKILALIIDHDLRPESSAEAEQTKKSLAAIGIEAVILHWEHPQVVRRLHENARKARYKLLTDACRAHGISHLLLAHHREDQAETILMRLAKGSGIDGLAGMAAKKTLDGVRILRPLLTISKQRLSATCNAAGVTFVSDPSNQSQKFARGRLRRIAPLLEIEGLTTERLTDLGMRAAEAKAALDYATNALLRVATRLSDAGAIEIDLEHLRSTPRAIALRALNSCLRAIHRDDYAPEYASLSRLLDAICADGDMPGCTLQGCFISKNSFRATVIREYAAITDSFPIQSGESIVWDQRWCVSLTTNTEKTFHIRALGNPPHERLDALAPKLRHVIPQGRLRATLPALWLNDELAIIPALPHTPYISDVRAELTAVWPPNGADG
jgi:tRNA(Ile)-lysidine synthase